jgi:hypothetical protein
MLSHLRPAHRAGHGDERDGYPASARAPSALASMFLLSVSGTCVQGRIADLALAALAYGRSTRWGRGDQVAPHVVVARHN